MRFTFAAAALLGAVLSVRLDDGGIPQMVADTIENPDGTLVGDTDMSGGLTEDEFNDAGLDMALGHDFDELNIDMTVESMTREQVVDLREVIEAITDIALEETVMAAMDEAGEEFIAWLPLGEVRLPRVAFVAGRVAQGMAIEDANLEFSAVVTFNMLERDEVTKEEFVNYFGFVAAVMEIRSLSEDQIRFNLSRAGFTPEQIDQAVESQLARFNFLLSFDIADHDDDGLIDRTEFANGRTVLQFDAEDALLDADFDELDYDNSGTLDLQESLVSQLDPEQLEAL